MLEKLKGTSRSESAAIVATGAAFFMIVLDTSIVNLALPQIKYVFHADLTALQWLVDGYALVFTSLLLNAGAMGPMGHDMESPAMKHRAYTRPHPNAETGGSTCKARTLRRTKHMTSF